MKMMVIPIIVDALEQHSRTCKNQWKNQDCSDWLQYCNELRRLQETWNHSDPSKRIPANARMENSLGVT